LSFYLPIRFASLFLFISSSLSFWERPLSCVERDKNFLILETVLKFTGKYKRPRQLVWRPFTKRRKKLKEREVKGKTAGKKKRKKATKGDKSIIELLFAYSLLFFSLFLLLCLFGEDRSPASSVTKTTRYG